MNRSRPKLLFFVTVDWFFCSHFLGRAIAAREAGYEVLVLTDVDRHGDIVRNAGLRLLPLPIRRSSLNPFGALLALVRILSVYRKEQPDLIHHVALKPILLGGLAACFIGCHRVINAVVGGGYAFTSQHPFALMLRPFLKVGLRLLLNPQGSRVVFENSDDLSSFVEAGLVRRRDSSLIRGAGVEPDRFQSGFSEDRLPTVVLVARLLWDKGIGEFVEAARVLGLRGVKARFVIVGEIDPDNRACIDSATLEAWKAQGVVELWGFRSDIPQVLREATVACLPSYREGLPKSLLEAMAAGLPCVTTDVPGCREAVRDGENGLLVPAKNVPALADALECLLRNPELARKMGECGRKRLEQEFSAQYVNERTLALYKEMLMK
ncbi:glycosyltransferase family 4 protein [Dechloromonas hortensis]|uniref:glycosyltransferase family 4 protein n=1 Tax=Dechloromonas hortensis TaxID=337779 RepID=UPI001291709F|nr:glycosyltransferase family 4 protein [Dechloromonas hortensis]